MWTGPFSCFLSPNEQLKRHVKAQVVCRSVLELADSVIGFMQK